MLLPADLWSDLKPALRDQLVHKVEGELAAARGVIERIYGAHVIKGLLIDTSLIQLPALRGWLTKYGWHLPWPLIRTAERQTDRALAAAWPERAILRHELAHVLFLAALKPARRGWRSSGYASDLPDWLDEVPAILAEDEQLSRRRRKLWHSFCRRHGRLPFPLARFLEMPHPLWQAGWFRALLQKATKSDEKGGSGPRVITISRSRFDASSQEAAMFYAQTRGVVDFLIRHQRLQIIGSLTRTVADGAAGTGAEVLAILGQEVPALNAGSLLAFCLSES